MPFEPQKITRDHILAAVEKIEREGIALNASTRWNVVIEGKVYPPKEVMRYAHQAMNGEYIWKRSGGPPTNVFLEKLGFTIVNKSEVFDPLADLVARYKSHIRKTELNEEIYKWQLVNQYAGKPDPHSNRFFQELSELRFENLIYYNAVGVLRQILEQRPEELQSAFQYLFDESKPLSDRAKYFDAETEKLFQQIDSETKKGYQDERSIATYLTFRYPNSYTFYKDSFYRKFCQLQDIPPKKKGEKYAHYLALLNDFIEGYILPDEELLELKDQFLPEDAYSDEGHLILAQDILFQMLDQQKGMDRKYWRIGTGDQGEYWPLMKENHYVSIGWSEIGDISAQALNQKESLIAVLQQEGFYSDNNRIASRKAGEILDFYQEIQPGDIVLAQDGKSVLAIGEVLGEYEFNESEPFAHCKPVDWQIIEPEDFDNTEGVRTTVYQIKNAQTIQRIEALLRKRTHMASSPSPTNFPLNQILFGPPGTGKTFHTINRALEICGLDLTNQPRETVKAWFKKKREEGQVVFSTFHQSMSYEDFVEGIKPLEPKTEGGPVVYKVEDGIFKRLCKRAETYTQSSSANIGRKLQFERGLNRLRALLDESENNEFTIPMVKKSFQITSINDTHIKFRKASGGTGHDLVLSVLRDIYLGQRDYNQQGLGIYYYPLVDYLRQLTEKETPSVEVEEKEKNFVLIIDEINRGNVSEIFGELITLIEADKRSGAPEELEVVLPYSGDEHFSVPPNLYLIGTMNTADRSVEALDTALRRRFSFVEMAPDPELIRTKGKAASGKIDGIDLIELLKVINRRIEKLLDKDHMIGHSYFLSVDSLPKLQAVFQNKILPLLQEYFFGDFGKIGLVLGKGFFEPESEVEESLFAEFDGYETEGFLDKPVYHLRNVLKMTAPEFHTAIDLLLRK